MLQKPIIPLVFSALSVHMNYEPFSSLSLSAERLEREGRVYNRSSNSLTALKKKNTKLLFANFPFAFVPSTHRLQTFSPIIAEISLFDEPE